jgi:hypothetical protein
LFDMAQVSSNIVEGFFHDQHLYENKFTNFA